MVSLSRFGWCRGLVDKQLPSPYTGPMRYVDYAEATAALTPKAAVEAVRQAQLSGFDPATDPERQKVALPHGEMHLSPSALGGAVRVKVLGIQPSGSALDVPLVQGAYLLMGGETLSPQLLIDAAALTTLRTPAVSVAGVLDLLRASDAPLDVVIFGTGAQGRGHADTLADVLDGVREVSFTFISRREPDGFPYRWVEAGTSAADDCVSEAGLVVTATSSFVPILDASNLREDAIVLAVGAHTVDTRELSEDVLAGAQVLVEDLGAARREAGDVVVSVEKQVLAWDDLAVMADVVRGEVALDPQRRVVFKTVGMPWEDLAVAQALVGRLG